MSDLKSIAGLFFLAVLFIGAAATILLFADKGELAQAELDLTTSSRFVARTGPATQMTNN